MAKIIGQEVEVAITKESTRGTAATAASGDWIERGELSFTRTKDMADIMANIGNKVTRRDKTPVHFENEVNITMPLERRHIGLFFMGMYGDVTTSADTPEAGVDTHDFEILNTRLNPTYTISVKYGSNTQYVYSLGLITNLELSLNTDSVPEVSVTFLTKKRATTTGLTGAYSTTSYFSPVDVSVYTPLTYTALSGANAIDIMDGSITWTLGDAKKHKYLGNDTHSDVSAADYDMTVHLVKHYDEETFASGDTEYMDNDYESDTRRALRIDIEDTRTTIGAATNPKVRVEIPACTVENYSPDQALKEVVGEEFDLIPEHTDLTNGFSIAQVINDVASY